ncbi:MAG TPA: glycosyltransferase family 2 protein [Solirubrobacterales bacterium]|nr:glycosyltransferase family 2 protein [Solirubrobacterales bacterium]
MSAEPQVAVVVPSWNSAGLLPALLDSLPTDGATAELVVVDNGSRDGTLALLRERGVEHIALPANLGFAAAMNRGVAATAAPFVLGLNADTVVGPGAIGALAAALAANPDLGGVAPRILQLEREARDVAAARLYSAGQALTPDGRAVELGAGEEQGVAAARPGAVFGVCGAACLLRRELFAELGGYDESFFAFYEDVDLNVRARIAGWDFAYVPEAVVWHLGNASWMAEAPRPGAWNARLVARNRIVTQARFMALGALPRILAVEVGALYRAARQGRLRATLRGKLEGLARLPAALRERRRLAVAGDPRRARAWLGKGRG